jgi:hypothetical protein
MSQANNGDLLKGVLHTLPDASQSLEVIEIKRIGAGWSAVPEGNWMPFTGGADNGGRWLHELGAPCCPLNCPGYNPHKPPEGGRCPVTCRKCPDPHQ